MRVTTDNYGSAFAGLAVAFGMAMAIILFVHLTTALQTPGSVPDCGAEEIFHPVLQTCQRVVY